VAACVHAAIVGGATGCTDDDAPSLVALTTTSGSTTEAEPTTTDAPWTGSTAATTGVDTEVPNRGCPDPTITPQFAFQLTDVSESAGLDHVQAVEPPTASCGDGSSAALNLCLAPSYTGGVAVLDVDGDGLEDLLFTRYANHPLLYRNLGDLRFADITAGTGIDAPALSASGLALGDLDGDGDDDLVLALNPAGRYAVLERTGPLQWTDVSEPAGLADPALPLRQGTMAALGDYDRDGDLDAFIGEWRVWDPGSAATSASRLFRNDSAGAGLRFTDVTDAAGIVLGDLEPQETQFKAGVFTFGGGFVDLDDDGWLDLPLSADYRTSRLFWNRGDGSFVDGTAAAGVGLDRFGMGSSFADLDGDGRLDWYVTSIELPGLTGLESNRLYLNRGNRTFEEQADALGVGLGFWGWGASMTDIDNDGDIDVLATNGMPANIGYGAALDETPSLLWERRDDLDCMPEIGGFVGLVDRRWGRALVDADLDHDGDLDVLIVNHEERPLLLRNDAAHGHAWLQVDVRDGPTGATAASRHARVEVIDGQGRRQLRVVRVGAAYLSDGPHAVHVGLGADPGPVDIEVRWLDGRERTLTDVTPNQRLTVTPP
jgi:hypothetical protein